MSLFKLKSLWSQGYSNQQFDQKHLAIGRIGKNPALALGNFQGTLRVFLVANNTQLIVKPIYQHTFEAGIIDVKFVSQPDQRIRHNTIGLLFFKKFAYVMFEAVDNSYTAKYLYIDVEPSFGIGVSPLSVMTLNSTIQCLNPLQTQKIKVSDPIYPYSRSMNKFYFVDGQELVQMQGSTQQWRIVVGRVRQLFVFLDTIVVIGQRALWEVQNSRIVKTKVMQDDISCGTIAFRNVNAYNIIVANFNGQLFIYSSQYTLLWAIKLQYTPLRIIVCQHQQIKGMLAILSEEGNLELAYSGVEQPDAVIQPLSQKIDYAIVQSETAEFMAKLKTDPEAPKATKTVKTDDQSQIKRGYKIYFGPIQKSYQPLQQKNSLFQVDGRLIKSQLICQITSSETLRNFKIQLNLPFNLFSKESKKEQLVAKKGDKISFNIYANNESFPYEREFTALIRHQSQDQKTPYIRMQNVQIPMGLQCLIGGFDVKQNHQNKLVIKSNNEMPSFNDLFPQIIDKNTPQQRKSLKLVLANEIDCVITYNKGYNKAKVQSKDYSGLCFTINQFSHHIRKYNLTATPKIQLSVEIPLQEFFHVMKQHYQHRQLLKKAFQDVQQKSLQFRTAQKKLLLKMKQKMASLGNIDQLLEFTYQRLMASASRYEQVNAKMDIINHNLCVAIKLIIELLFIRSNPSTKAKNIAVGILGYEQESLEMGWQEKIVANSSYFLNKKYNKDNKVSFEQLQKIPLFVISKVNNGDWN